MKYCFLLIFILLSCSNNKNIAVLKKDNIKITKEDSLTIKKLGKLAFESGIFSQEHQKYLDTILYFRPNNASLWQEKAMPCFKAKKYEVGMFFLDKAVELEPENYLDYRAFIKCVFSKQYKESIIDFNRLKEINGNLTVMDHSYNFYLGLCYLQLNEFEKANALLQNNIDTELKSFSEDWISPTDWFYLGVSYLELKQYEKAIQNFDIALKQYPTFSDAQFYKYKCLQKLNMLETAKLLLKNAYNNHLAGYTISETNTIYETYPYQVYKGQYEYLLKSN